jgi:NAD(P)-dependent dehydrogenase (short-subunit alcohol dehydrogenase family)
VTAVRDLEERVAVITGAGGEIGTAIATRLAARGAAIVVNHRDSNDAEAAQRTAAAARAAGSGLYSATKAAAEQLSLALARELGARGVTVNVVSPGPIDTAAFRHGKARKSSTSYGGCHPWIA